jgi:hypothetical protein
MTTVEDSMSGLKTPEDTKGAEEAVEFEEREIKLSLRRTRCCKFEKKAHKLVELAHHLWRLKLRLQSLNPESLEYRRVSSELDVCTRNFAWAVFSRILRQSTGRLHNRKCNRSYWKEGVQVVTPPCCGTTRQPDHKLLHIKFFGEDGAEPEFVRDGAEPAFVLHRETKDGLVPVGHLCIHPRHYDERPNLGIVTAVSYYYIKPIIGEIVKPFGDYPAGSTNTQALDRMYERVHCFGPIRTYCSRERKPTGDLAGALHYFQEHSDDSDFSEEERVEEQESRAYHAREQVKQEEREARREKERAERKDKREREEAEQEEKRKEAQKVRKEFLAELDTWHNDLEAKGLAAGSDSESDSGSDSDWDADSKAERCIKKRKIGSFA